MANNRVTATAVTAALLFLSQSFKDMGEGLVLVYEVFLFFRRAARCAALIRAEYFIIALVDVGLFHGDSPFIE